MGAQSKEKEAVSPWGGRKAGGGDCVPAAPTVAVDRRGPGKGFLGPCCRPWGPPRLVLLEVDRGWATLPAGTLGGRLVVCLTRWVLNQRGLRPAGGRGWTQVPWQPTLTMAKVK